MQWLEVLATAVNDIILTGLSRDILQVQVKE